MTRAALLALRTAGTLRIDCHYVITDGPVIGTAGNTSPTQIEMHAISTTELSEIVTVNTAFAVAGADGWRGVYAIDLGAAGSIIELTDNWTNTVRDSDPNSPTVHNQFPWHRAGANLRDNLIDRSTLPGWATAAGSINDNNIRESSVDLTGRSGGTSRFNQNTLRGTNFTCNTATAFINDNQLELATVSHVGTGAGSFSFQNNVMLSGSVVVDAATTSQITMNNNVFGGTAGGYRVNVTGKTTGILIFSGNRAFNQSAAGFDLLAQGTGDTTVVSSELNTTALSLDGAGPSTVTDSQMSKASVTKGAGVSGPVTVSGCIIAGTTVTFTGAGSGGSVLSQVATEGGSLTMNGASSGAATFRLSSMVGSTLTVSASGVNAPVNQNGRLLGTTLDTAGFQIDTFDIVGGTKTLTANQSDRLRNASFTNLV